MKIRALIAACTLLAAGTALAQGVTESEIVLGQSAALTGPAQQLGKDMRAGAMLYFDQVNEHGGVYGRRIVLKTLDDGYESDRAAANTRKLINDEIRNVGKKNLVEERRFSEMLEQSIIKYQNRALSSAEVISAWCMTSRASVGSLRFAFSSMSRASTAWSRLPQLTPMRTGLS